MKESVTYKRFKDVESVEISIHFKYYAPRSQRVRQILSDWGFSDCVSLSSGKKIKVYMSEESAIMFKLKYEALIAETMGELLNG